MAPMVATWWWPQRLLHWLVAGLVTLLAALGVMMVHGSLDVGSRFALYQLHKSFGVLAFCLMLLRIAVRLGRARPPMRGSAGERRLAGAAHLALYGLLLALPLSGWVMASASPFRIPTVVFGLFTLPAPVPPGAGLESSAKLTHEALAIALGLLVLLHVAAALKHHWRDRDDTLSRMGAGHG